MTTPIRKPANLLVVGAGPVGALWATRLAKRGHQVRMIERRPDLRSTDISAGRSINVAMSGRGLLALDQAGVGEVVRQVAIPMHARCIHDETGATNTQPYGQQGQYINSVSRGDLNGMLLDAAQRAGVQIDFQTRCTDIAHFGDGDTQACAVVVDDSGTTSRHQADAIFGTDGAFSAVRAAMQITDRFDYSQSYLAHGYKELLMPPGEDGGFQLDPGALHIWPRGTFMLIALANPDHSFTCTLFLPHEGDVSFASLDSPRAVDRFFAETFPDFLAKVPDLSAQFFANPVGSLATIRCAPWNRGHTCLLGDAAHAIVPFYGQGMVAGFEDCTVFERILDDNPDAGWADAFDRFSRERKKDADAIADLALYNFIEMRDRVADARFVKMKQIERKISEWYPERYLPLYSMVTFSHMPYSQAWAYGKAQEELMQSIVDAPGVLDSDDVDAHEDMIRARVDAFLDDRQRRERGDAR